MFIGNDDSRADHVYEYGADAQRRPTVFIGNDCVAGGSRSATANAQRRPTVFIGNDQRRSAAN